MFPPKSLDENLINQFYPSDPKFRAGVRFTKIKSWHTMSLDDNPIYSFFLGFLGFLDLDLALQRGQMGALRWICWWQERQDFIGGGCCLETNRMISLTRAVQKLDENELSD